METALVSISAPAYRVLGQAGMLPSLLRQADALEGRQLYRSVKRQLSKANVPVVVSLDKDTTRRRQSDGGLSVRIDAQIERQGADS